jgi:hypothetical protein
MVVAHKGIVSQWENYEEGVRLLATTCRMFGFNARTCFGCKR